jgi:hypothetical protein
MRRGVECGVAWSAARRGMRRGVECGAAWSVGYMNRLITC